MPQSLAQIYLHVVFSTKNRAPFLQDENLRSKTHAYLAGICKNLDSPCLKVGGVEDHVHLACRLSKKHSVMELIKALKETSSKWIKVQEPSLSRFYWQAGYGAFSVSPGHVPALLSYIENQEEHHRKESFQDEFRRLLKSTASSTMNVMCGIDVDRPPSRCVFSPFRAGFLELVTQGCASLALGFDVRPLRGQYPVLNVRPPSRSQCPGL